MAQSKIDKRIEYYQKFRNEREKEGRTDGQTPEAFDEELHWISGVIFGLKTAKNI